MISTLARVAGTAGLLGLATAAFVLPAFVAPTALAQPAPQPKAGAPRPGQPAPAAAPAGPPSVKVPLKAAPEQPEWLKVCGDDPSIGKKICYTTRDFVAENNQPVMAVAVYAVADNSRRFARFLVPLTFLIQPGIRFSVEGLQPVSARFQICLPQGCFVEGELNDAAIAALKKAPSLRIDMQNQVGQEVNFELPMGTFGKVFDSAGIDQETLQKMQDDAQKGVQPQQGGAPSPTADDLKKRGEELAKQRQQAPKP